MEVVSSFFDFFVFRWKHIALLNLLFFGCVFVSALVGQFLFGAKFYYELPLEQELPYEDLTVIAWDIFVCKLFISAFFVITLPGIIFFPLSVGFLLYRGVLWGFSLYSFPKSAFFLILPALVIEGEAYVLAALAGWVLGFSWVKPPYFFDKRLSRWMSFEKAFMESVRIYVLVFLFLLVGASVEALTIPYVI